MPENHEDLVTDTTGYDGCLVEDALAAMARMSLLGPESMALVAMYQAYSGFFGQLGDCVQRQYHQCSTRELKDLLKLFLRIARLAEERHPGEYGLMEYAEAIGSNPVNVDVLRAMDNGSLMETMVELARFMSDWCDDESEICEDVSLHPEYLSHPEVIRKGAAEP